MLELLLTTQPGRATDIMLCSRHGPIQVTSTSSPVQFVTTITGKRFWAPLRLLAAMVRRAARMRHPLALVLKVAVSHAAIV